jgi:hypothetical protein
MSIMTLAIILLTLRFMAVAFMIRVLSIQFPLLQAANDPHIRPLRYVLFVFAVVITLGNAIPIMVDLYGFLNPEASSSTLGSVLTFYFLNNAFVAALSAACFWLIYKVTGLNTDEESNR